jgi:hypothetical protein
MRIHLLSLLVLLISGCGRQGHDGEIATHIPVTVAGVTYNWPSDGSLTHAGAKGFALLSRRMWNATVGVVPSANFGTGEQYLTIWLGPARIPRWNISLDGSGLPLFPSEHFAKTMSGNGFTLGQKQGAGIVNPSTVIVFSGEHQAYAECSQVKPDLSSGSCALFMNDRGVQHTLPIRWGAWESVPTELRLYRQLIGAPTGQSA